MLLLFICFLTEDTVHSVSVYCLIIIQSNSYLFQMKYLYCFIATFAYLVYSKHLLMDVIFVRIHNEKDIFLSLKILCSSYANLPVNMNGMAPAYITELLQRYTPTRAIRSADQLLLVVPRPGSKPEGTEPSQQLARGSGTLCPSM